MGVRTFVVFASLTALIFATESPRCSRAGEQTGLPSKSDQSCLKCHDYDKQLNVLAGKFVEGSVKAKALQLQIDKETEIIYFDDATVLRNATAINKIPKSESVKVTYVKRDGKPFATAVDVKKGIAIPQEQLLTAEEVAKLVALGPEKGKYVLLDSRPENMFNEGHIPTALSMPFFAFDKLKDKLLPQDKDIVQIYYCAGFS
jgi:hypothetical protein